MAVILSFIILAVSSAILADDCQSRSFSKSRIVCVCNATYCHTIDPVVPVNKGTFLKYTSNKAGLRLKKEEGHFEHVADHSDNLIKIGNRSHQSILGFGGAFTDSAGLNILTLSERAQEKLMRAYFSEQGIEYSVGRVPIGGADFSTRGYSYHDDIEDPALGNFSLAEEDMKYKIPIIQRAIDLSKNGLELFSSAWVAPKWMKVNGEYAGYFGFVKEQYYQTWADYFVKFLDEYLKNGITFWGITTGNEPANGILGFSVPSVAWDVHTVTKWISTNLGPTIRNSKHSNIKIIGLDDQRTYIPGYVDEIFKNEDVKAYIDGIGIHWYLNILSNVSRLDELHRKHPDKFILTTEACKGSITPEPQVVIGSWSRGEEYAASIIEDVNHWAIGWVDWNIALDMQGGPNFVNNFVDAPILINASADEFYMQPMYYAMGHFSKFVPRGSVRIESISSNKYLEVAAFRRPDGGIAVVILNKYRKNRIATLKNEQNEEVKLEISANSITTVLYWSTLEPNRRW